MDESPRRVSFPPLPWALLGIFGVLMIGLLVSQLVLLERQRELITRQTHIAAANREASRSLFGDARPLAQDLRPVADDLRRRLPQTRRAQRDAADLVVRARALLAELARDDAPGAIADAGSLARRLLKDDRLFTLPDRVDEVLATQKQALTILQQSLAVQQESLQHIRSLDAKTGGTAPNSVPAVP